MTYFIYIIFIQIKFISHNFRNELQCIYTNNNDYDSFSILSFKTNYAI